MLNLGPEIEMQDFNNQENKPNTPSTGENASLKNHVSFESNGTRHGEASFHLFGEPHVHQSSLVYTAEQQQRQKRTEQLKELREESKFNF